MDNPFEGIRQVGGSAANEQTRRLLENPKIANSLARISDPESLFLVIEVFNDLEETNMKSLAIAETYEELISCREFSKVIRLTRKKFMRLAALKKAQSDGRQGLNEQAIQDIKRKETVWR